MDELTNLNKVKFLLEGGKDVINEFLLGLTAKEQEKVYRNIRLLNDLGFQKIINTKMIGSVKGQDNLWYLRASYRKNIFRIFFFIHVINKREVYILLHGFQKKTQKIPAREIKLAKARKASLLKERRFYNE